MAQQFYLSSLWWITLDERSVKGRIHLNTCQPILTLIPSLSLAHPQLLIRIDQFHGDLPVECGWLLLSSRKMNCISLQRQLSTLAPPLTIKYSYPLSLSVAPSRRPQQLPHCKNPCDCYLHISSLPLLCPPHASRRSLPQRSKLNSPLGIPSNIP